MIKQLFSSSVTPKTTGKNVNRLLWLTDTYEDHNGVSMVLQSMHKEIKKHDLPIDILVSSQTIQPDDHLIVVRPLTEFNLSLYQSQTIRIPNYREIRKIFIERKYNRVICSTEGPMGMAALYLKRFFSVKTYFFLHTDWIMFASAVMKLEKTGLNQVRRLLRFYYHRYDGLFVLNTEQQEWLSGKEMRIDRSRVFLTAHWVDDLFHPVEDLRESLFHISQETPVLLFAGRLSEEKGVLELPELYRQAKEMIPGLTLVFAGTGPAEEKLRAALPEARFLGWVDHRELPGIYSSADLLILPSRFDTFSCVVLEAISCGLPVIAYNSKGPKDILQHRMSGFLAEDTEEMKHYVTGYFSDTSQQAEMKHAALNRAKDYQTGTILDKFITDVGIRKAC